MRPLQTTTILSALLTVCLSLACLVGITGCSKVPAGHVGVKVYLLGGSKGVDSEVLSVGRYWIGWNEELYLFPTFQQTKAWTRDKTEGSRSDQSFTFQTREGLSVNSDVSVSYTIDPAKISILFQKYRKGVDEITDVYLRNLVRDALVQCSCTRTVESIYGEGKTELIAEVRKMVADKMAPVGISIDMLAFIGELRLPGTVIESINAKITATQRAQQRENELREAKAQADKQVAKAEGDAKSAKALAEGEAEAVRIRAEAQAEANAKLAKSLTPELVEYEKVRKWNGELPQVSGAPAMLSLPLK